MISGLLKVLVVVPARSCRNNNIMIWSLSLAAWERHSSSATNDQDLIEFDLDLNRMAATTWPSHYYFRRRATHEIVWCVIAYTVWSHISLPGDPHFHGNFPPERHRLQEKNHNISNIWIQLKNLTELESWSPELFNGTRVCGVSSTRSWPNLATQ